ncbi:hypothetical protein D3C81_2061340 [compost metagenome]
MHNNAVEHPFNGMLNGIARLTSHFKSPILTGRTLPKRTVGLYADHWRGLAG